MRLKDQISQIYLKLKIEIVLYKNVFGDGRTPLIAKVFLALALGYLALPFDLIPDFIPVIGHIDDALLVPLFIALALRLTPPHVVEEHRQRLKGSVSVVHREKLRLR